jgi:hypothetical protein
MPRLDEVFKKSGVPTHTFVAPSEFDHVVKSPTLISPKSGEIRMGHPPPAGCPRRKMLRSIQLDSSHRC